MAQNLIISKSPAKPKPTGLTWKALKRMLVASAIVLVLGLAALVALVSLSPATGAGGADLLRHIVGPKPVAGLEAVVLTLQDTLKQLSYTVGQRTPPSPWSSATPAGDVEAILPAPTAALNRVTPIPMDPPESDISPTSMAPGQPEASSQSAEVNLTEPSLTLPSPTPLATAWVPEDLAPMGQAAGEGRWEAYIVDDAGTPLAYRTYLQPDASRAYAFVGIVAIDLNRTRLNYVPGITEPASSVPLVRPGTIRRADMQPGTLLAAFNGGFKAVNGFFGAYTNGVELLPPQKGLGTLAIYQDGAVQIGDWGSDMEFSSAMQAYRQNCPLILQDGVINPQIYNNSINDWGGTFSGSIVTFRSGVGISQDGSKLYYFAGTGLSMPALADAMLAAGAYHAMQLDINNYYVLFTRLTYEGGEWRAEPLLPNEMIDNVGRFLEGYSHDYFYLTKKG